MTKETVRTQRVLLNCHRLQMMNVETWNIARQLKYFFGNFCLLAYLLIFCQIVSCLNFASKILLNIIPLTYIYLRFNQHALCLWNKCIFNFEVEWMLFAKIQSCRNISYNWDIWGGFCHLIFRVGWQVNSLQFSKCVFYWLKTLFERSIFILFQVKYLFSYLAMSSRKTRNF